MGFIVYPSKQYVKLWSGDFQPSSSGLRLRRNMSTFGVGPTSSSSSSSYQVNLEVRTREGVVLQTAISRGAGELPVREFSSLVFHKTSNPRFGELVKISNIDVGLLPRTHIFFTFRARSQVKEKDRDKSPSTLSSSPTAQANSMMFDSFGLEKPFAFAYLPLFPEGGAAFVPDGDHQLILYKTDKLGQTSQLSPSQYFELPSTLSNMPPETSTIESIRIPPTLKMVTPMRDSMVIRSFLCSTDFTQSPVLLRLLGWDKPSVVADESELLDVLRQLPFASEFELTKAIKPTLDALFAILEKNPSGSRPVEEAAFDALVVLITLAQDRRFVNLHSVGALIIFCLLHAVIYRLDW